MVVVHLVGSNKNLTLPSDVSLYLEDVLVMPQNVHVCLSSFILPPVGRLVLVVEDFNASVLFLDVSILK
jgi:hypothetical protein